QYAILAAVCGLLALVRFRLTRIDAVAPANSPSVAAPPRSRFRDSQFRLREVVFWTTAMAIALGIARALDYWGASLEIWQQAKLGIQKSGIFVVLMPTPT